MAKVADVKASALTLTKEEPYRVSFQGGRTVITLGTALGVKAGDLFYEYKANNGYIVLVPKRT